MESAVRYQLVNQGYHASRRLGGLSLRSIAWVVLASWLFTFVVCSMGALGHNETPRHHTEPATLSHVDKGALHDGGSLHEDVCCTILENLSAFSQANNIQIPLHNLAYVLLPIIVVLPAVLFVPVKTGFFATSPPGKPNHVLIANSLWPNAPPR